MRSMLAAILAALMLCTLSACGTQPQPAGILEVDTRALRDLLR